MIRKIFPENKIFRKRSQVPGSPFRVPFVHKWLHVRATLCIEIIPSEANPISRGSHPARANCRMPTKAEATRGKNCPYCTDISKSGKLINIISGMRSQTKNEVHTFLRELFQKIHSGTFNAAEMAENAPDRLKVCTEKTGVELEDVLNQWEDKTKAINEKYSTIHYTCNPAELTSWAGEIKISSKSNVETFQST